MACLCDFCSAPEAEWRHPARSFIGYVAPCVVGKSVGDWAACQRMSSVDRLGRTSAIDREIGLDFHCKAPGIGVIKTELTTEMGILHTRFFDNRTGPASVIA